MVVYWEIEMAYFLTWYLQPWQIHPISKLSKGSTPVKTGGFLLPRVEEKALHLAALGQIHDRTQTSTASFPPFMRST